MLDERIDFGFAELCRQVALHLRDFRLFFVGKVRPSTPSAAEAIAMRGRSHVAIVDLREKSEREKNGVIPGSLHAPYPALPEHICAGGMLQELAAATGKRIVFYCAFGERSAMAVQAAQDAGLTTACHIQGGIDAWKKAGGPLGH